MKNPEKIKQNLRYRRQKRVRAKIRGTTSCPRFSVFRSSKHIYAQLIDDEKGKTLVSVSDFNLKSPPKADQPPVQGLERRAEKTKGTKLTEKIDDKVIESEGKKLNKKEIIAYKVGYLIAEQASKKKIKGVIFDRGGYKYHGRVKALAEGARAGGLQL